MHSKIFEGPNRIKGVIHHNGDWSGDAEVKWGPADSYYGWSTVRIPGWLARAMLPRDVPAPVAEPGASNPTTIQEWCAAAYGRALDKGFHDGDALMSERERVSVAINNLHSEVSEMWEAYRAGTLHKPCNKAERMAAMGLRPLTCIEEEMADVALRNSDNARAFGVDLQEAMAIKHAYNGTRAARHGGKLA